MSPYLIDAETPGFPFALLIPFFGAALLSWLGTKIGLIKSSKAARRLAEWSAYATGLAFGYLAANDKGEFSVVLFLAVSALTTLFPGCLLFFGILWGHEKAEAKATRTDK